MVGRDTFGGESEVATDRRHGGSRRRLGGSGDRSDFWQFHDRRATLGDHWSSDGWRLAGPDSFGPPAKLNRAANHSAGRIDSPEEGRDFLSTEMLPEVSR